MHIAITGASGNAGTALLRNLQGQLARKPGSLRLTAISRRLPDTGRQPYAGVDWHCLDVGLAADRSKLEQALAGVDAVVHLAWQIQPNRDLEQLYRTNVTGTRNVLAAAKAAGVKQIVCASSVGAYSKAPKDQRTDESWPAGGMAGSHYSRHKAEQEEALDRFAAAEPGIAVARLRPGLIFQGDAGSEIGRYFLGPVFPRLLPKRLRIPLLTVPEGLIFQAVHADDVAEAYWRVVDQRASGAFNIAAEPWSHPRCWPASWGQAHPPHPDGTSARPRRTDVAAQDSNPRIRAGWRWLPARPSWTPGGPGGSSAGSHASLPPMRSRKCCGAWERATALRPRPSSHPGSGGPARSSVPRDFPRGAALSLRRRRPAPHPDAGRHPGHRRRRPAPHQDAGRHPGYQYRGPIHRPGAFSGQYPRAPTAPPWSAFRLPGAAWPHSPGPARRPHGRGQPWLRVRGHQAPGSPPLCGFPLLPAGDAGPASPGPPCAASRTTGATPPGPPQQQQPQSKPTGLIPRFPPLPPRYDRSGPPPFRLTLPRPFRTS